jgi:hypothetical protein
VVRGWDFCCSAGVTTTHVNTTTAVRMSLSPQNNQQNLTKKILAYSSSNTRAFSFFIPSPSYTRKKKQFLLSKNKYNKKSWIVFLWEGIHFITVGWCVSRMGKVSSKAVINTVLSCFDSLLFILLRLPTSYTSFNQSDLLCSLFRNFIHFCMKWKHIASAVCVFNSLLDEFQ